jgi:hypothetical protein
MRNNTAKEGIAAARMANFGVVMANFAPAKPVRTLAKDSFAFAKAVDAAKTVLRKIGRRVGAAW